MRRITASEARRNWFQLLDEVAAGEVVVVERRGCRIVLSAREERVEQATRPNYRQHLQVPEAEKADQWGWEWTGLAERLALTFLFLPPDHRA